MDIEAILTDSFTYAQEALVGKWIRWAIFILFALPFSLIRFVVDPKKIIKGTMINWGAIPWGQIAVLAVLGIILSFFLSGYSVRIYRGIKPAPDFKEWTGLFVDGVKLTVVWFLWILPVMIVLAAGIAAAIASYLFVRVAAPNIALLFLVLMLVLVACILIIIVVLFGILGAVRFARTGSIREGIRVSAILTTIRTMGWLSYIILLIGFIIACVIYAVISRCPDGNPVHRLGPRPYHKPGLHDLHRPVLHACVPAGRTKTGPTGCTGSYGRIINFFFRKHQSQISLRFRNPEFESSRLFATRHEKTIKKAHPDEVGFSLGNFGESYPGLPGINNRVWIDNEKKGRMLLHQ